MPRRNSATTASATQLRALAHPTRLRLLGLLRTIGPRTAAGLAEYIDEAPGTLSYHLGTLSAAGLITEHKQEGRDRRERWWQAANATTSWDETSSSALSRQVMQLYAQQYEHYLDTASTLSDDWRAAGNTSDRVLRLTSREAAELSAELTGLLQRWAERSADADAAPAAANGSDSREPVFVLIQSYSLQS